MGANATEEAGDEERAGVYLKAQRISLSPGLPERHKATAATMAASRNSFRFPPEILLGRNNFYTVPPEKPTASSQRPSNREDDNWLDINTIIAPKGTPSSKSKKKKKRDLTPTMVIAKMTGLLYSGTS